MRTLYVISLLFIFTLYTQAQSAYSIKGVIKTSDNQPAELAQVQLKGTNKIVLTNSRGEYMLENVSIGVHVLIVQFTGTVVAEQTVEVINSGTTLVSDIIIKEKIQELNEVTIVRDKSMNENKIGIGKAPIKSFDLPQSSAYLDKKILEQQQTIRISDAIKNFNGVYIMGTSGGYQEELAGRGFSFGSSNTFKNGVRFNNSAMPEMSSLERIEILKGSAAILFGNVAAGGIINIVTKKPIFENGGEVAMQLGSYDFYKPSIDIYGSIDKNKKAAYRVSTAYEKSRSFRDNVNAKRYYINPSFLFKIGKKTDFLIEGDYLNDDRTADFGIGAIDYTLISIPRNQFIGVAWSYYKAEQQSTTITTTHHLNNKWQISNVISYQNHKSDLFANQRPNGNSQFIKPNGDWIRGIQKTVINETYYLAQLDITGSFSTGFLNHQLIIGADADKYLTKNTSYNPITRYDTTNVFYPDKYKQRSDIPTLTPRILTTSPIQRAGLYVQDLLSINKKIKLLAGARISYLETFSNTHTYSNATDVKTEKYDHAISPRLGLVYQPIKTMSLFSSYSNSFTPNSGVNIDGVALPPSLINQYEVGVKNDLLKNSFSINVTAYQIKNNNLAQVSLANGNTNTNIKELAGEVTSKGIEVDVMSKEYNGLSVLAGYSFNDTRYTKSNTYVVGSQLRYNPNHTANSSVYYNLKSLHIKCMNGFHAGLGALYIGDRMAGRSTRINIANDSYKLIPLPAYISIDASIGYTIHKLSVKIKVNNITNVLSYNVHDDNSVNPIAPRQFNMNVCIKF